MKLNIVKQSLVKTDDLPSFVISDDEQSLFLIRKSNDKPDDEKENDRISALWTNYDAFMRVLRTLFVELWNANIPLQASIISTY